MRRQGVVVAALESRPVLILGLDIYLQAYSELIYEIPGGFGGGFIGWTSITNWCKAHGVCDIDEIDYFVRHIRALEKKDLELLDKKKARKS